MGDKNLSCRLIGSFEHHNFNLSDYWPFTSGSQKSRSAGYADFRAAHTLASVTTEAELTVESQVAGSAYKLTTTESRTFVALSGLVMEAIPKYSGGGGAVQSAYIRAASQRFLSSNGQRPSSTSDGGIRAMGMSCAIRSLY